MKSFLITSIKAVAVCLTLAASASAVPLPAWTANPLYFNVNSLVAGPLQDGNITLPYYKLDFPATESGNAAAVAALSFVVNGDSVLFTWTPQGSQTFSQVALKQGPGFVVWDTSGVNWANYTGFYVSNNGLVPPAGGVSHVTMAGAPGTGTGVPDGGSTVALLGLGLAALALIRRKMTS